VLKAERETVIRWDSEDRMVWIDSYHPHVWRKVERAGYIPARSRSHKGREIGRVYKVPLEQFRFRLIPSDRSRRAAPRSAFKPKPHDKPSEDASGS
jgi:hypothetical protein